MSMTVWRMGLNVALRFVKSSSLSLLTQRSRDRRFFALSFASRRAE